MSKVTVTANFGSEIPEGAIIRMEKPDDRRWRKIQYGFISIMQNKYVPVPSITEHRYIKSVDSNTTLTISNPDFKVEA